MIKIYKINIFCWKIMKNSVLLYMIVISKNDKVVKKMKLSDVRVRLVQKQEGRLKGVASVTIEDSFVIHDIKILEGENGYFIAMPSKKTADGSYRDVAHPISTEARQQLVEAVIQAFNEQNEKTLNSSENAWHQAEYVIKYIRN